MAGKKHQFIIGLIVKQMREYGCKVKFVEKKYLCTQNIKIPPQVLRHRPDIFGITDLGQICIGEAKTESDINSARTKEQLKDFSVMILNDMPCEVFLGMPKLCKDRFEKILHDLNIIIYPNLHVLYVPEEIINV